MSDRNPLEVVAIIIIMAIVLFGIMAIDLTDERLNTPTLDPVEQSWYMESEVTNVP
jgi:hypothetical protein